MKRQLQEVTERIIERSKPSRGAYLERIQEAMDDKVHRANLSCGNLAHGFAASNSEDKQRVRSLTASDIGIVSAYNDVLSAHQPYRLIPDQLKEAVGETGGVAQFAGGVPAMCDGVTQGQPGMDLSLMSRDVIAMATAISLTHNLFDGALMLGICDKIVPGLLMGSLSFGHLPVVFVPGGPMPTGLPNEDKAKARKLYAQGKIPESALLDAESQSYHAPGTCTFYGTANTNQLVVELMGLQLPGSSFVNPYTPLRDALTRAAGKQVTRLTKQSGNFMPMGKMVDEKSLVNGLVGLMASGGSTNHTMHMIAVARAAGIIINWDDFSDISANVPLLCRIYPNGEGDINHFHHAGGMAFLIKQLLDADLLHNDVQTITGPGLDKYQLEPVLEDGELIWHDGPQRSIRLDVLAPTSDPFDSHGGLRSLKGNLGDCVIKTSALKDQELVVEAPAVVFHDQHDLMNAFKRGELDRDCIVVVRFQGPKARGMPELHRLTPPLGVLQDKGYKVALVTDGRMSGASGSVAAAIHLSPEAVDPDAPIGRIRDGDMIRLDAHAGTLEVLVSEAELAQRTPATCDLSAHHYGFGRELFGGMRSNLSPATEGACFLFNT